MGVDEFTTYTGRIAPYVLEWVCTNTQAFNMARKRATLTYEIRLMRTCNFPKYFISLAESSEDMLKVAILSHVGVYSGKY